MTTQYGDLLFVFCHFLVVIARVARINDYGPSAIVFTSFFDVFFALPVYLDLFLGLPAYSIFAGISNAVGSESVRAISNVIVLALSAAFSWFLRQRRKAQSVPLLMSGRGTALSLAVAYAPLFFVVASGNLSLYSNYGAVLTREELQIGAFHNTVGFLIGLSMIAGGLLIVSSRHNARDYRTQLLLALPAVFADVWLMGKRSILAFLLLMVGLRVLDRYRHKLRPMHGVLGMAMVIALMVSSWLYQSALRPDTQIDATAAYDSYRIDMARDHALKLVLYRELNQSETPILEHRLQSFLFILTSPVPRTWWPDKPWPFAVYLTSAALGGPVHDWGWGLTTDLVSESIANMGLVGLVPCCGFFIWAIRRIDRSHDPVILLLGTLSICSLLVLQFAAVPVWHFSLLGYVLFKKVTGASMAPPNGGRTRRRP